MENFLLILLLGQGPISQLYGILGVEIEKAFYLICAIGALILAWMRKFTALVSFGVLMLFVALFIFAPDFIGHVGSNLGKDLFKGWSQ